MTFLFFNVGAYKVHWPINWIQRCPNAVVLRLQRVALILTYIHDIRRSSMLCCIALTCSSTRCSSTRCPSTRCSSTRCSSQESQGPAFDLKLLRHAGQKKSSITGRWYIQTRKFVPTSHAPTRESAMFSPGTKSFLFTLSDKPPENVFRE